MSEQLLAMLVGAAWCLAVAYSAIGNSQPRVAHCAFFAMLLFVAGAFAVSAFAYEVQATWDAVPGADSYAVEVNGAVTAIVPGGSPTTTTSVSVRAVGLGTISPPSNTLTIPALMTECERMDVDGQQGVTATDVARIMQAVVEGECP